MPTKMRALAKDIARQGQLYMLPLVGANENGQHIVYDGNRRITCIKLLVSPTRAPDADWRRFFQECRDKNSDKVIPTQIICQISDDQDWIDDYLYRIHTGSQNGVGQINWGNPEKSNFVERTGKSGKIDVSRVVEEALKDKGLIDDQVKFRHTNLDRILSSEEFRHRVGVSLKENKLYFVRDPQKTLNALAHIVACLSTGELNLNHLLKNDKKREYLASLEEQKILPTISDKIDVPIDVVSGEKSKANAKGKASETPRETKVRKFLIRLDDNPEFASDQSRKRAKDIWTELQFRLEFGKHDNSIAVLFRVLIEFSIQHYIEVVNLGSVHNNDSLAKKFGKVLVSLEDTEEIDRGYSQALRKFQNTEPIISANTFNKYVHDRNFYPSDHHLRSMWDTLYPFLLKCLQQS
jgi:hypothetical protein